MIHTGTRALHGQWVHLRVYQSCWLVPSRWRPRALRHSWGDLDAPPPWQEHSCEADPWLSTCLQVYLQRGRHVDKHDVTAGWSLKTHIWLRNKCWFNVSLWLYVTQCVISLPVLLCNSNLQYALKESKVIELESIMWNCAFNWSLLLNFLQFLHQSAYNFCVYDLMKCHELSQMT